MNKDLDTYLLDYNSDDSNSSKDSNKDSNNSNNNDDNDTSDEESIVTSNGSNGSNNEINDELDDINGAGIDSDDSKSDAGSEITIKSELINDFDKMVLIKEDIFDLEYFAFSLINNLILNHKDYLGELNKEFFIRLYGLIMLKLQN